MATMNPLQVLSSAIAATIAVNLALPAVAQTVVRISDLEYTAATPKIDHAIWMDGSYRAAVLPRVVIEGHGAVIQVPSVKGTIGHGLISAAHIAVELDKPSGPLTGTLYLPDEDGRVLVGFPFTAAEHTQRVDPEMYSASLAAHYAALAGDDLPGRPYFRRRHRAFGADSSPESSWSFGWMKTSSDDTFAMFTGGRALAENLRLDDVIADLSEDEQLVALKGIPGLNIPAMEWGGLVRGIDPVLDPLSVAIPDDQFAAFFPSFEALLRVADQVSADAAPLVQLFDERAAKQLVRERYETQLCLKLDGLTRRLGGTLIKSAALTGSDPYLRTGTDIALLLEGNAEGIAAFVRARQSAIAKGLEMEVRESMVSGWPTFSVQTDDRRVSSWVAATDKFVVVANSEFQLMCVLQANDGARARLSASEEYRWFRARYPLVDDGPEDALLVVTDAAIRRWCGPKWRIATARRINALAHLSDVEAWRIAKGAKVEAGAPPAKESPVIGGGDVVIDRGRAYDSVYGTRAFLTPIAEMMMSSVTKSEEAGYLRWRLDFEMSWGAAFDPLAVRIDVRDDGLDVDLTVIPLIVRTEYRQLIDLAGSSLLAADVPAIHPEALVYWVSAIDHDEPAFSSMKRSLRALSMGRDELDWVGDHIAIWIDEDDEYFERIADVDSADMFLEEMLPGLPVGVRIDTKNPLAAAAFLTAVRGLAEEAVPGMFEFERRDHDGHAYVAIVAQDELGFGETPTLFYAATRRGLVLSFSQGVVERALERAGRDLVKNDWENRGVSLTVRGETRELVAVEALNLAAKEQLRAKSWRNLPILNEWKRNGASDPVAFHETHWGTRLICPGGGEYVWNEEHQTMQSTVYGHPAEPIDGPNLPPALGNLKLLDFGLSFESFDIAPPSVRPGETQTRWSDQLRGLRAQIKLRRE